MTTQTGTPPQHELPPSTLINENNISERWRRHFLEPNTILYALNDDKSHCKAKLDIEYLIRFLKKEFHG